MRLTPFLPLLFALPAFCQTSTFDTNNEGWTTFGDATSPNAAWLANGGNPGGYIRVTDQSVGGTWYFVAPSKFLGNKCDAYGTRLRYDQITNDTTNESDYPERPDIVIFGAGLTLVFNNVENPNLTWTHYDVLLREDAGWRLNNNNGPVPTQAQFRAALSDISGLRIRGEYRPLDDYGGLDNVILESSFGFDLDGDDSSGAFDGDFLADTLCVPFGAIADFDAVLFSEKKIDSIVVKILYGADLEALELDAIPGNLDVETVDLQKIILKNAGGATPADFLLAIQLMHYNDLSPDPARGERLIEFRVYTECGEVAIRYAYLPIYPAPNAGQGRDTLVCAGSQPFDLFSLLKNMPQTGGSWSPKLASGTGVFDPAKDAPGRYAYFFPNAGECPGDTAYVEVFVEQAFQLGPDTTICNDDTLTLKIPPGVGTWQWSDGSREETLKVTFAGTYALVGDTENCVFTDSVRVDFYTCEPCPYFAPNVFSPDDDGLNDTWQVFLPCAWLDFHLEIYDRWGSLVFASDDPEMSWDGFIRGREPQPGVYVWSLEWTGELFGQLKAFRGEGDVTVLR
jgi:gliding motility-associated-like protein